MRNRILYVAAGLAGLLLIYNLYAILLILPDELEQGPIYRIFYFHLPAFFTAAACYLTAFCASVVYLAKKNPTADAFAVAATEVGLPFAAVNLITGMIWARIIWGIWWTWDARLTWALICWLIYFGYLLLRRAIPEPIERAKNAAVLNVFAFFTVVITYKAIDWWRTQHPGAVLSFRTGGGTIDPAMENMLYQNWLPMLLLAAVLIAVRMRQEQAQREIESLRRAVHAV